MALALLVCIPLYYLWKPFTEHNPWPRRCLRWIARLAGVQLEILGQQRRKGAFLLANHISWIDIPAIAGATGTAFVAHDGLAAIGPLRWLCGMNDTVFIARHERARIAEQVAQVREAIRETGALTIFPEGTTGDGAGLKPFKSSLLSALTPLPEGVSIHPVWLDYGSEAGEIAWVGDESGIDNFLRILARDRPIPLAIHLLPPLEGSALTDRKRMAAAAHAAILEEMRRTLDQRVAL